MNNEKTKNAKLRILTQAGLDLVTDCVNNGNTIPNLKEKIEEIANEKFGSLKDTNITKEDIYQVVNAVEEGVRYILDAIETFQNIGTSFGKLVSVKEEPKSFIKWNGGE